MIKIPNSNYLKIGVDSSFNRYDLKTILTNITNEASLNDIVVTSSLLPKVYLQYSHETFTSQVVDAIMQYPNEDISINIDNKVEIYLMFDESRTLSYLDRCLIALEKLIAIQVNGNVNAPKKDESVNSSESDSAKSDENTSEPNEESKPVTDETADIKSNESVPKNETLRNALAELDKKAAEPEHNEAEKDVPSSEDLSNSDNLDNLPSLDDTNLDDDSADENPNNEPESDSDQVDTNEDENDNTDKDDTQSKPDGSINDDSAESDTATGSPAKGTITNVSNIAPEISRDQIKTAIASDENLVTVDKLKPIQDKLADIEHLVKDSTDTDHIKAIINTDDNLVTVDKLQDITKEIADLKQAMSSVVKQNDLNDYIKHSEFDTLTDRIDDLHTDFIKSYEAQTRQSKMLIDAFIEAGKRSNAKSDSIDVLNDALRKIDGEAANELQDKLGSEAPKADDPTVAPTTIEPDNQTNSTNSPLTDILSAKDKAAVNDQDTLNSIMDGLDFSDLSNLGSNLNK